MKRYRIVARLELIVTAEDIDTARQIAEDLQVGSDIDWRLRARHHGSSMAHPTPTQCAWNIIEPLDEADD